jgi:hypothetical protein
MDARVRRRAQNTARTPVYDSKGMMGSVHVKQCAMVHCFVFITALYAWTEMSTHVFLACIGVLLAVAPVACV